ncbi:uncharacterized protein LOC121879709 isoform X2 [Homarus americanus]|nr:uncharacterized protein LOC121879709 isoform X2 [Homarus americanus]
MAQVQSGKEENVNGGKRGGIQILIHSKKQITSVDTLPRPARPHSNGALWDNGRSGRGDAASHSKFSENIVIQSHKDETRPSNSMNLQNIENQREESIFMPEIASSSELTPSSVLRLTKHPETDKLSVHSLSITEDKVINKNTYDEELVLENREESNIDTSPVNNKPKRRRGRPRKGECSADKGDDVLHTCKRIVKTKSRTVIQPGECNCVCNHLIRDGNRENSIYQDIASDSAPENIVQEQNTSISSRKRLEGNFEHVKDYVCASLRVRDPYKPWRKNHEVVNGKAIVPEYKIQAFERHKRSMEMQASQRYSVFHTWESVLACKNRVEEETRSKYNLYSRTNTFKDDKPKPYKRVLFELKRSKGDAVVVPCSGVPLMWIGNQVYTCHLGKPRFKTKTKLSLAKKNHQQVDDFDSDRPKKNTPSKKVGCPATFSVTKIARFPDFELTDESKCRSTVSAELRNAWTKTPEKVRYYIEYHVKRPRLEDHQGHIFNKTGSAKFQEPIDPRIIQKIRDLSYEGVTEMRHMMEHISSFIREEIFKDCQLPPPERRRYNPSVQDYRNTMKRARLELQRAGRSVVEIQCSSLIKDLGEAIRTTCNEEYLNQLKELLTQLLTTVRDGAPLDPYLACQPKTTAQLTTGSVKKRKPKRIKPDVSVTPSAVTKSRYSFYTSQPEQATQVELPQDPETQLDGVTQIYYYQQMAPGEEVYGTEVVDSAVL